MLLMDLKATLVEKEVVGLVNNMVSTELAQNKDFELITGADMRQMAELEAEKQNMGCADNSSCLAELAGAMGARYVMFGEMGKLGSFFLLTLNLFDSAEAKSVARDTLRVKSIDEMVEKLPPMVNALVQAARSASSQSQVTAVTPETSSAPQKAPNVAKAPPQPPPATAPEPATSDATAPVVEKGGASMVLLASGVGLGLAGAVGMGFGAWGLSALDGVMTATDSTKSQREMVIVAYEGSPYFIGVGLVALGAGGYLMFGLSGEEE